MTWLEFCNERCDFVHGLTIEEAMNSMDFMNGEDPRVLLTHFFNICKFLGV